jgi:hypothetical protein
MFTDSELIALLFYKELAGIESERQFLMKKFRKI